MIIDTYLDTVQAVLAQAAQTQRGPLLEAARLFADAAERRRKIFAFGCSHAGLVTQDMFYRSGGLAVINPLFAPGLTLDVRPVTLTSQLEREPGYGRLIVEQNRLEAGDVLLLHSVSGRNHVPIDMALAAAERGVSTVCLTNLRYSRASQSRHPSGKKLYELCDVVIDNCGCVGDAACELDGLGQRLAPTSTAVGAALVNAIAAGAIELLLERGVTPPVFVSANLEGGDEHNARILEQYGDCIRYLL